MSYDVNTAHNYYLAKQEAQAREEKMTAYTLTVGNHPGCTFSTVGDLLNGIESFVDEELKDRESSLDIKISSQQMTQEEFDNLPEFEGY